MEQLLERGLGGSQTRDGAAGQRLDERVGAAGDLAAERPACLVQTQPACAGQVRERAAGTLDSKVTSMSRTVPVRRFATVSRATSRPSRMMPTRSATASTSLMMWLDMKTV
ncbi:hypothetical protein [Streptomyces sp. NRRL B-24572]|uniref:hypothetical protein n=1 Tax=Streptomyces sp. NRRL B-24572 TaxID=1962156 RepID=UPI001C4E96AB|nr:hypothetical protein [Streptomyces sp. NRRL B-24572]